MVIGGPGHFSSNEQSKCATVRSFIQLSAVMKSSTDCPFTLRPRQHLAQNLEWNAVERSGASSTDNHRVVLTMLSPPRKTRAEADGYSRTDKKTKNKTPKTQRYNEFP